METTDKRAECGASASSAIVPPLISGRRVRRLDHNMASFDKPVKRVPPRSQRRLLRTSVAAGTQSDL